MPSPPHVVVAGSGLAGYGVLRELRRLSPGSQLTLITHDDGHFYSKPGLSTALAKGKAPEELVTIPAQKMVAQLRLDLRAGREVEAIDRAGKVLLTTGGPLSYDALVLAVGAAPIRPKISGDAAGRAIAINHLDDYTMFREALKPGTRVLIIGAGLVGSEFANDLALSGYKVTLVDLQPHPLAQLVPAEIGIVLRAALEKEGVAFHPGKTVEAIDPAEGGASRVTLGDGTVLEADTVISAVGLRPRIQLADEAGLVVDRGIVVDETGRTSDPSIYAIGDCAQYPQGVAAFVTPIMAAARAIAASVLGNPTPIRFPALSVQVKTTTCPIVLLPPPPATSGSWVKEEGLGNDLKFVFKDSGDRLLGYALTGRFCEERTELDRRVVIADNLHDKTEERMAP